jgi:hypothetical protein
MDLSVTAFEHTIQRLLGAQNSGRKFYHQLLTLQDIAFKHAVGKDTELKFIPGLIHAWCELDERKRIMRGKPLPGVLKPTNTKRGKVLRGNAEIAPIVDVKVEPDQSTPTGKDGGIDKGFQASTSSPEIVMSTPPVVVEPISPDSESAKH